MIELLLRKSVLLFLSLWLLMTLTFLALVALPGTPFSEERSLHPLVAANIEGHWSSSTKGLQSFTQNYFDYLRGLASGYLGPSLSQYGTSVEQIISRSFKVSFYLNFLSFALTFCLSLALGFFVVLSRQEKVRQLFFQVTSVVVAIPSLFVAPMLIYFFGLKMQWLPVAQLNSSLGYILPLLTLCIRPIFQLARFLVLRLLDFEKETFVVAAMAKGLSWPQVARVHLLKISLVPFVLYSVPTLVSLLSGTFLVEVIFAIPGLGTEFVNGIASRDYTLVLGVTLLYGSSMLILSQLADYFAMYLDPRQRVQTNESPFLGWFA